MSNLGEQQHPPNHDIDQMSSASTSEASASKRKSSRCCSNHIPLDRLEFEPSPSPASTPASTTLSDVLIEAQDAASAARCLSPAIESPSPTPMELDGLHSREPGVLDVHRLTDTGRFKAAQASRALKSHLPHAYHEAWKPTGGATPIPFSSPNCTIPSLPPLPSPLPSNGSVSQSTHEDTCQLEYRQPKRARVLAADLEPSSSDYTQNPIPGSPPSTASTLLASSTRFPNPLRGVSSTIKSKATQPAITHYHSSRRLFASARSRLFKPTSSRARRQAQRTSALSVETRASSLPPDYGRSPLFSDYDDDDFQNRHHPHGPFWYKLRMTPTTPTTPSHTQSPLSAANPNASTKGKERDNVESVTSLQSAAINAALGSNVSRSAAGLGEASPSSSSGSPPVSAGPSSSCMVGSNHSLDDASRSGKPLLNHHIRLPLPTMPSNIPNSYSLPSVTSPMSSASRTSAQSPFARITLPQVSLRVSIGSTSSSASSSTSTPATSPLPVHAPPHIPSIYPLINRETLRELDLEVILRSPQLRHDLLFDPGLQFRPTSGRRKRDATERYWEAIAREMEWGCTCTSFDERGRLYTCVCGKAPQGHRATILPGSVFKASSMALHPGFVAHLRATQSRIMPLLTTLRDVLGSVIHPSSTIASPSGISSKDPSPSPPLTPTSQSSFSSDAPPSPTASTSSSTTDSLLSSLDPSLIEQEIRHGVFDYQGVFRWVGEVMKMHCAPMRDTMVENMVRVASGVEDTPQSGRGAVKGLRMCFEILEVMKLDIANHQLQALRPYLLDTSSDFELKTFQERYEKGLAGLTVTQRWMSDAARAVQPSFTAATPRVDKSKFVMTALCHAMVNLVFKPPLPTPPTSTTEMKPSSSRKHPATDSPYPETLYLDHARLQSYFNDASDLLGLYMLVMLFRQLTTVGSKAGASLEDWEIDRIKREVWEVGPSRLGMCFDVNLGEVPNAAEVDAKWQKGMNDVMLQVGMRAEEARERFASGVRGDPSAKPATIQPPKPETQSLIQNWMRSNYKKDSPLQKIMKDRLCNAVLEVVKDNVLGSTSAAKVANSSPSSRMKKVNLQRLKTPPPTGKSAGNGLEPLVPEIMHLGERIARLVLFHGKVYKRLYEVEGFLQL